MKKKLVFTVIYALYLLLLLETGSRAFWVFHKELSFFKPNAHYIFYPDLKKADQSTLKKGDDYFDLLILGGSVARSLQVSDIKDRWKQLMGPKEIRVFNVAQNAQTMRDSYLKYKYLKNKSFDKVIIYHAINDVRANNCPDEIFKEDYSHYAFYQQVNLLEQYKYFGAFTLPFTIHCWLIEFRHRQHPEEFLPVHIPNPQWTQYGDSIKSAVPFKRNLEAIIAMAEERDEPILLPGFAYHVPKNFSSAAFKLKQLDYGSHLLNINVWGEPTNVLKGIIVHNKIIQHVATTRNNVEFIDMNDYLPKDKHNFDDICHLSKVGQRNFIGVMIYAIFYTLKK